MRNRISRRALMAGAAVAQTVAGAAQPAETLRLPKPVRLAMLGLDGHTSEVLGHLRELPDVTLVAASDPDARSLERLGRSPLTAGARRYSDWRKLLDSERDLDMVATCGPNGERPAILLACAQRKLHIVAEKPLAIEKEDLARIKEAVAANGVRLTSLLPMRFYPPYAAMKQLFDEGAVGEVAQIGAQKSYQLGERPQWMRNRASFGGTIPYIGVHMVDLMRFTSGREMVETMAFQGRVKYPELGDMENTTSTIFRLDNGGTASLRMDYLRPDGAPTHGDDRLRVAGTEGVMEYQAATGLTLLTRKGKTRPINLPPPKSLFLDFLASVYLGKPVGLSLDDIYRVNEIVLAARDAAASGRVLKI